jgi:hypothetical protein
LLNYSSTFSTNYPRTTAATRQIPAILRKNYWFNYLFSNPKKWTLKNLFIPEYNPFKQKELRAILSILTKPLWETVKKETPFGWYF